MSRRNKNRKLPKTLKFHRFRNRLPAPLPEQRWAVSPDQLAPLSAEWRALSRGKLPKVDASGRRARELSGMLSVKRNARKERRSDNRLPAQATDRAKEGRLLKRS